MSAKEDILKACNEIGLETLTIPRYRPEDIVNNISSIKKELKKYISIIDEAKLHFTHTQFDIFCFLLVNEYSKNSKNIEFYDIELVLDKSRFKISKNYIYSFFIKLLINLNFRMNLSIRELGEGAVLSISNSYILERGVNINSIKNDYNSIVGSVNQKINLNYGESNIIFLGQNYLSSNQIDKKSLLKLYEYLEGVKMDVKHHPYMKEENAFVNHTSLPTYLPSELLYSNRKIVLSVNSVGLIAASFMDGVKAVSLMGLIKIIDSKSEIKIKEYLIKESKGKILFPKSIMELDSLIKSNIVGQIN